MIELLNSNRVVEGICDILGLSRRLTRVLRVVVQGNVVLGVISQSVVLRKTIQREVMRDDNDPDLYVAKAKLHNELSSPDFYQSQIDGMKRSYRRKHPEEVEYNEQMRDSAIKRIEKLKHEVHDLETHPKIVREKENYDQDITMPIFIWLIDRDDPRLEGDNRAIRLVKTETCYEGDPFSTDWSDNLSPLGNPYHENLEEAVNHGFQLTEGLIDEYITGVTSSDGILNALIRTDSKEFERIVEQAQKNQDGHFKLFLSDRNYQAKILEGSIEELIA